MSLTEEESKVIEQAETIMKQHQEGQMEGQNYQQQFQDVSEEDRNRSITHEQLDLSNELNMIEHLLKGERLLFDEELKVMRWTEPDNKDMILFSEHGVNKIMQTIQWYINKNLLLSNFTEDEILAKMEDFSYSLIDNIFMKYELYFRYPTLEECEVELEKKITEKVNRISVMKRLRGEVVDEEVKKEIRKDVVDKIEMEREIFNIRDQKIKDKLKDYDLICRCIQDAIHSTYNRALKGMERTSLRKHHHVSESFGVGVPSQQNKRSINPLDYMPRTK